MEKIKEPGEKIQRRHQDLAVGDRQGEKEEDTPATQRTEAVDVEMAEPIVKPPPEVGRGEGYTADLVISKQRGMLGACVAG